MSKQIVLEKSARADIIKTFGISPKFLWEALTFRKNSSNAQKLRAAARVRRGVLVDFNLSTAQGYDTYFSEVPKQMIQVLSDRVWVVSELNGTGDTSIEVDGETVKAFKTETIDDIVEVRKEAQVIVKQLN